MQEKLTDDSENIDLRRIKVSLFISLLYTFILWLVKIAELSFDIDFTVFGLYPRKLSALQGILFSPFIHSDFSHLIANSSALFVLLLFMLYFYRDLTYRVLLTVWLISGLLVWSAARPAYHIGISGIIYGLATFLFFSGIFRNDIRLMAISLIDVFLYGSMVWGVLPLYPHVSWEYHLFGAVSGIVAAIAYRNQGPPRKPWSWELEDDEEDVGSDCDSTDESIRFTDASGNSRKYESDYYTVSSSANNPNPRHNNST